jgi:hypothetical protein
MESRSVRNMFHIAGCSGVSACTIFRKDPTILPIGLQFRLSSSSPIDWEEGIRKWSVMLRSVVVQKPVIGGIPKLSSTLIRLARFAIL